MLQRTLGADGFSVVKGGSVTTPLRRCNCGHQNTAHEPHCEFCDCLWFEDQRQEILTRPFFYVGPMGPKRLKKDGHFIVGDGDT